MPVAEKPYGSKGYDRKCPDGFVTNGWRKICKGGYVNFQGERRYAEEFEEWAGCFVFMEISDYLAIDAHAWMDQPWHGECVGTYIEREWKELLEEERISKERVKDLSALLNNTK